MMAAGIADNPVGGRDAARPWNFFEVEAESKEIALRYGRYLWGRILVRNELPPPARSKLKAKLREWAKKVL